jgi:tetratricopeptide (TPR) repeat protein
MSRKSNLILKSFMHYRFLFIVILLLNLNESLACLNENRVLLNGEKRIFDTESLVPYGRNHKENTEYYQEELRELDSLWKKNKKLEDYSDYGVLLVYLGRYDEAKKVFNHIEKINPGLYSTAANLGTTYELMGNDQLALEWIRKAVTIDSTSHDNSEWLHVKILEAKLKGKKAITDTFLISTNFGSDVLPKTNLDSITLVKLRDAIYYQLDERVSFVKPKDQIVALLLFELGNICAITDDVTSALRIFDKAKEYGFESAIFRLRYAHFLEMQSGLNNEYSKNKGDSVAMKSNESKGNNKFIVGIAFVLVVIAAILIFRDRNK